MHTSDESVLRLVKQAFGDFNGRRVEVKLFPVGGMSLNSYWSGGSRDYYTIVSIADGHRVYEVEQNGTMFDGKNHKLSALPEGFALVNQAYFGGKVFYHVYVNAANMPNSLPEHIELTPCEQLTLAAHCSLKGSYGGGKPRLELVTRKDSYRHCNGWFGELPSYTLAEYNDAVESLKAKGMLNWQGAVNIDGRNADENRENQQRKECVA